ncbi:MAG: hypothetical protein H8E48_07735 [Chloroflexi bacterium]|nr:hypothetical protein [Chloroflexota bacterium]
MNFKKPKLTGLLMAVGLMAMVAAAACGGGDPEELDIPVSIHAGEMDPGTIKVKQGDMVTLKIQADEGGEFHLHTYDIEKEIEAETETDFYFVAEATGRFKITYHPQGDHDDSGHGILFESEELDTGDTFSYEIEDHQAGETVPFHSHLRPALHGNIIVSQEAGVTDTVAIEYNDEAAVPNEVHVGPGTVITWTNISSNHQTVISGLHADMGMDAGAEKDEHDDEHDDEEVEIEIGFVEVQPR